MDVKEPFSPRKDGILLPAASAYSFPEKLEIIFRWLPMKTRLVARMAVVALAGALLSSCASVSVDNLLTLKTGAEPQSKPQRIYVVPYSVERTNAKESFARESKGRLKYESRELLTKKLVVELSQHIAPARELKPGVQPGTNSWVVSGTITRVAEGSRFLRMGLGLGLGGSKLETKTTVRVANGRSFLEFDTSGGSNAMPGGVTNPIPFSGVPTALLHTGEGVTDDCARTARMITAAIANYMVRRGWMDSTAAPEMKLAGE